MRASRRLLLAALACVAICILSAFAAAQSDEAIAERVLGPQWKLLSRRAEMVFAGTVLNAGPQTSTTVLAKMPARMDRTLPVIELTFHVDHPIAGVEPGQVLTIHEWAGAWSLQRPMRRGEHILIFLYAPSRLGLTSPVGGWRGQIALDASGQNILEPEPVAPSLARNDRSPTIPPTARKTTNVPITVVQLERAIRAVRGE
jgi:hypothetical protein